uniref:Glyco_hydro_18 domain-containing protein n=1 Tax=Steinernema glaseri TaxID=37863 RepID=A0A1I8AVH9_9BILA
MIQAGAEVHRDEESKTPYIVRGNQWFSYDDEESFGVKLDWVIENGFGGAFTWALDMDDFNGKCAGKHYPLHSVITKKLTGNEVSSVVPTTELPPVVVITTSTEKPLGIFCDGQPDGFQSHPKSCESFLLCLKSDSFSIRHI